MDVLLHEEHEMYLVTALIAIHANIAIRKIFRLIETSESLATNILAFWVCTTSNTRGWSVSEPCEKLMIKVLHSISIGLLFLRCIPYSVDIYYEVW